MAKTKQTDDFMSLLAELVEPNDKPHEHFPGETACSQCVSIVSEAEPRMKDAISIRLYVSNHEEGRRLVVRFLSTGAEQRLALTRSEVDELLREMKRLSDTFSGDFNLHTIANGVLTLKTKQRSDRAVIYGNERPEYYQGTVKGDDQSVEFIRMTSSDFLRFMNRVSERSSEI